MMGFDVETFNFMINSGFREMWDLKPIPCDDTSSSGNPQPGGRSLAVNGALGFVRARPRRRGNTKGTKAPGATRAQGVYKDYNDRLSRL